ncbi:hypothetical protein M3Y97_00779900 [Aphelenchoides bicaudatus]|nr:hypothetical protein M3Y97_00779900 [Aphelenchoides bicaudatus]
MVKTSVSISLCDLCVRSYSLALYKNNARWRKERDVSRDLLSHLKRLKIPLLAKKQIYYAIQDIFIEVERWDTKHSKMFPEEPGKKKRSRADHLRTFHESIKWMPNSLRIDDFKSAKQIIDNNCADWPQLKFQFACMYALEPLLKNDWIFDKVRRKVFRQQLSSHCVYDLWLRILDDPRELNRLFREDRLLVDQLCVQVIHFACISGYFQLAKYFWRRLNSSQKEAIGFLVWKKVCYNANSPEIIKFMCKCLCNLNPDGMLRLTWDSFYYKVCSSLENDYDKDPKAYIQNIKKLQLLLENVCPVLRNALIARKDCKALSDAFWCNNFETFSLLLNHSNESNLKSARDVVDKIYGKKRTQEMFRLRQSVLCRQQTIE